MASPGNLLLIGRRACGGLTLSKSVGADEEEERDSHNNKMTSSQLFSAAAFSREARVPAVQRVAALVLLAAVVLTPLKPSASQEPTPSASGPGAAFTGHAHSDRQPHPHRRDRILNGCQQHSLFLLLRGDRSECGRYVLGREAQSCFDSISTLPHSLTVLVLIEVVLLSLRGEKRSRMPQQKQAEEAAIAASGITTFDNETEQGGGGKVEEDETASVFSMKNLLWHGGSAWDAWFSCASNQVLDSSQTNEDSDSSKGVVFSADGLVWLVWGIGGDFAGGAGAVDATVLLLATGDAVRGDPSAVLRLPRKLDGLPHQRTVHRVPHPKGEGKRQLQEPRYPGQVPLSSPPPSISCTLLFPQLPLPLHLSPPTPSFPRFQASKSLGFSIFH
ncbi:hypothetical protein BHE74_00006818 [Ensete ventricosum]|nr:hypothetical protein GW17_00018472 [Ensete ventricosum]RWW84575.1 hypothetical protein BHE74_00006818 [Ensete ventricosum]